MLKSRIQGLENNEDKIKLLDVISRLMEEIEKIHVVQKNRGSMPVVKKKRPCIRIDVNETVNGPENMGIRPLRPVNISHMPEALAPFTVLLEVSNVQIHIFKALLLI